MRIYEFFRYDIPHGIKNLIYFLPVVWVYRDWDYVFTLALFYYGLRKLKSRLENGNEINETRLPKVEAIEIALFILDHIINDNYLQVAENELGYKYNIEHPFGEEPERIEISNRKISKYSRELEMQEWQLLKNTLFGDNVKGTDMRGWWD